MSFRRFGTCVPSKKQTKQFYWLFQLNYRKNNYIFLIMLAAGGSFIVFWQAFVRLSKRSFLRLLAAMFKKERWKMSKDIAEKRLEEYNDVFANIYNNLFFEGKIVLQEADLVNQNTESYVKKEDGELHENRRDVRKVDKYQNVYRLICGLENQTGADNTMPERVMGYDYAAYEAQISEITEENRKKDALAYGKRIHDDQKLAPVITGVLYWGNEDWTGPLRLHDMLRFPEEDKELIKCLVPDYPMNLIEVSKIPKEIREKMTSDFRWIVEFLAYRKQPKVLKQLFADKEDKIKHPQEFLELMREITTDKRYSRIKEIFVEEEKGEIKMCEFLDLLLEEGKEEGIKEGITTLNYLNIKLAECGRADDIIKAAMDQKYQKDLLAEYGLI